MDLIDFILVLWVQIRIITLNLVGFDGLRLVCVEGIMFEIEKDSYIKLCNVQVASYLCEIRCYEFGDYLGLDDNQIVCDLVRY